MGLPHLLFLLLRPLLLFLLQPLLLHPLPPPSCQLPSQASPIEGLDPHGRGGAHHTAGRPTPSPRARDAPGLRRGLATPRHGMAADPREFGGDLAGSKEVFEEPKS